MNIPIVKARAWDILQKRMWPVTECIDQGLYLRPDGEGFVNQFHAPANERFIPIASTGEFARDGKEIFAFDIVEGVVDGEKITDHVHFEDGAWRFGEYDGTICDYAIEKIVGNSFENPWPIFAI